MRLILKALAIAFFAMPSVLRADGAPVVVELFTSQGCSSCPPADAMLLELSERPDVIALALHVDYWDYIGWADVFADPAYTQRQHAYARAAGHRTVYTPQMVIGGETHVVGTKPMDVADAIAEQRAAQSGVTLDVSRSGSQLQIRARASADLPGGAIIQVVRYTPRETVEIRRGENAGRELTYGNIVTQWRRVAEWDGQGPLALNVAAQGRDPVVVIVQEPGPGAILAAAQLR